MVSTGFFRENRNTGRKVEINEVTIAIPNIITTGIKPKLNSCMGTVYSFAIAPFISIHAIKVEIIDRTEQIKTIINDSEKKILNTSDPLAPTALKIPISRFLLDIETDIKLKSKSIENTASTTPTHKNTSDSILIILVIIVTDESTEFFTCNFVPLSLTVNEKFKISLIILASAFVGTITL